MTMSNLKGEGEVPKQYGIAYGGEVVGSYDTAKEGWEAYKQYEQLLRPMIDPRRKYNYSFRDGRNSVTLEEVRIKWRPR